MPYDFAEMKDPVSERLDRVIALLEKLCELTSSQSLKLPTPSESGLDLNQRVNQALRATGSSVQCQTLAGQKPPLVAPSGTTESKSLPKRSKGSDTSH